MVQEVTVEAQVVNELGHVSALAGEHHLGGGRVQRRWSPKAFRRKRTPIPKHAH